MEYAKPSEFSKGALNFMKFATTDRNRLSREASAETDARAKRGILLRPVSGPNVLAARRGAPGAPWRLPSGQLLVEYALSACFNGPTLLARFPYTAPAPLAQPADEKNERVLKSLENLSAALKLASEKPETARKASRRKTSVKRAGGER